MIPKIIHYCWLSGDEVPENLKKCMDSWKKIIPDYEFVKWDFTKFDKSSSAWVSEAFDNRKYAFACDYIRLYAVYNYGGIYLDMDMEVLKRFDDFLNQQYMLAYERESCKGIEAGCFGAEPHSEYIKRCLDYYTDRHFIKEDGSFDQLPLPQIMQAELDKMKITAIPYSCSVERGLTGSKQSITRETVSAFYTNGTKTDVSNGRGPAKKQNRFLISSCAGFWKV